MDSESAKTSIEKHTGSVNSSHDIAMVTKNQSILEGFQGLRRALARLDISASTTNGSYMQSLDTKAQTSRRRRLSESMLGGDSIRDRTTGPEPRTRRHSIPSGTISVEVFHRADNIAQEQYQRRPALAHLRGRIALATEATYCTLVDSSASRGAKHVLCSALYALGSALKSESADTGEEKTLLEAIKLLGTTCILRDDRADEIAHPLGELGSCLVLHFQLHGKLESLSLSIEIFCLLVGVYPDRVPWLNDFASALHDRFRQAGNPADLEDAIRLHQQALDVPNSHSPDRQRALYGLASAYITRYHRKNIQHDLETAIDSYRALLELLSPGHPKRPICLHALGFSLQLRFAANGSLDDFTQAISILRDAVRLTPEGQPGRTLRLSSLGDALLQLYQLQGQDDILSDAIEMKQQAIKICPTNYPMRPTVLASLADLLAIRFQRFGQEDDLDLAIELWHEQLATVSPQYHQLHLIQENLALGLEARYKYSGNFDDLDDAVYICRKALTVEQLGHHGQMLIKSRSGALLLSRFELTRNKRDLDEAILLLQEALVETDRDKYDHTRLDCALTLAMCLKTRFEHEPRGQDIWQAFQLAQAAILTCPSGYHTFHAFLWVYGDIVRAHYIYSSGEGADIHEAHRSLLRACVICPSGHPDRLDVLFALFRLHISPETPLYEPITALSYFKEAIMHSACSVRLRLQHATAAMEAINLDTVKGCTEDSLLLDIHTAVVSLMPQVVLRPRSAQHQIRAVQHAESIALNAAVVCGRCRRPDLAVELLEQGRATFWSQSLRLRTGFEGLPPDLRDQLRHLTRTIDSFTMHATKSPKAVLDEDMRIRRISHARIQELLVQVRTLPGYEQFLLAPRFDSLYHAASHGPLVILIASKPSCTALIVTGDGAVEDVALPTVSVKMLNDMSYSLNAAIDELSRGRKTRVRGTDWNQVYHKTGQHATEALRILWNKVVKVVLHALRIKPSHGRRRPRLWWCLTGAFSFLPIHAAGHYGTNMPAGNCCTDYVVSSYTPTISGLLKGREGFVPIPRHEVQTLMAAVPVAFEDDWPTIPGTGEEVRQLKKIVPRENLLLLRDQDDGTGEGSHGASMQVIEDNITSATILHLSSHGFQDPDNPLSSGFVMSDGMLTVERLMKLSLPNAFLAFLSACETAKGDLKQPDQAIHLAAAMLFVGFRSVVGTMWSIDENDGIFVATEFHKLLFGMEKETIDADDVAYALDEAIQMLRRRADHPGRWASYIHLGI